MINLLADSTDPTATGIAGIGALFLMGLWGLCFIYGVMCFLVPIFIYRIMRRGTELTELVKQLETVLRKQLPPAQ